MPAATVHRVLAEQLGRDVAARFADFDDHPAAAASIGQVTARLVRRPPTVAVKVQYPGAGPALLADLAQLSRFARMFAVLSPGLDIKPLLAELRARVTEELDYALEADAQRAFAAAYADDPEISSPGRRQRAEGPGHRVDRRDAAGADHRRRRPGASATAPATCCAAALLRAGPGRAAARRPAPGQLPAAARRPARA